jgi:alpha-amylase
MAVATSAAHAQDVSAPAVLQDFENRYSTIESRLPDVFATGYGAVYTPPPGRADSGNQSVGYDQYDRFDLGKSGNPTLYGTETGLRTLVAAIHTFGGNAYVDFVMNHDGFSDNSTSGFVNAGGYPGFAITLPQDQWGDFHPPSDTGDLNGRLAGLIDIAHEKNYQFIRNPVDPSDPRNLPAGRQPAFGRIANVPDPANARFYPDRSLQPIYVYDPNTGEQNIAISPFNNANPLHGTPVPENAMGYLMRNAQWLVQSVGVDGFRIDAAKNMPLFVENYFDRAVYRSSFRTLLNGQQQQIFSFVEDYESNPATVQQYIHKNFAYNADGSLSNPGVIQGNRDALDFPLFFAMRNNLSGNGLANDWRGVANASIDVHDDGLHNGSQGVMFVQSQDDGPPFLSNVAYAYTLMMPGNANDYFNGHEFGTNRNFPQDGRGDALGGTYGNAVANLVDLRNRYGRGNYTERWLEKENFAYERQGSSLVLLSNRLDAGFDSRTLTTSFAAGTPLVELTGNAGSTFADPHGDIPKLLVVKPDHTVNVRFLRNSTFNLQGQRLFTGDGYLVYGLPTPQGTMSLSNVAQVLKGSTPSASDPNAAFLNGTTRLSDINVIKGDSFQVTLKTTAMSIPGFGRDRPADGDNALLKLDGGLDINGNGRVDFVTPNTVTYGFEQFTGLHNPGYSSSDGNGLYAQTIDASKVSEGMHYVEAIAFRHRDDVGPAVYSDWRQAVYVDRLHPDSTVDSFAPAVAGVNENRLLTVRSKDLTANSVHVFFDLPASLTNSQILAMVGSASQTSQIDRDLFQKPINGVTSGNHVATVVSYEMDGNVNVQRFSASQIPALGTSTAFGAGLGDTNFDGKYTAADVDVFRSVYYSANTRFNAAADMNGDGLVDKQDVTLLGPRLRSVGAAPATLADYNALALPGDVNGDGVVNFADLLILAQHYGGPAAWSSGDVNADGSVGFDDLLALAQDYGQTISDQAAQPAQVPEPAAFVALFPFLLMRRR